MKMLIHKYALTQVKQTIDVPVGAKVLTAQLQGEEAVVWVEFDPEQEKRETLVFFSIPTGQRVTLSSRLDYVATVQIKGFVVHVYYGRK